MSFLRKTLILFVISMSAVSFAGQKKGIEEHKFIVSTEWLANHLNDKDIVLIEIGDKAKYEKEHLPGAVFLQTSEISTPHGEGLTLQIPEMKKLIDTFEKAGVSNNSRIILYYGNDWVTPTARFYLTLDYMGLANNTSILDGGLPQWKKENRKVTSEIPKIERGKITISNPDRDAVVDVNYVEKNLDNPKVQIVDARTENYYSGGDSNYSRPGHIAGATNIPFPSITSEDVPYLFKSKEELKKIFENANVKDGKSVICYCHIGQQASLVFFAAKYLGYDAHLYDGSYQEWDKRTDLPVIGAVKRN